MVIKKPWSNGKKLHHLSMMVDRKVLNPLRKRGYQDKSWRMPGDWGKITSVDIYKIRLEGLDLKHSNVPLANSRLILSLREDEAVSIVPAGMKPS
jgi:hypothetical protein